MITHYIHSHSISFLGCIGFLDGVALAILFYAAFRDVLVRQIPNAISLLIFALGMDIRYLESDLLSGITYFSIVLFLMSSLWKLGFVGGADAKLVSVTTLLFGHDQVFVFLLVTAICGGLLGLLYLWMSKQTMYTPVKIMRHGLLGRGLRAEKWRIARKPSLPYAVAIAASASLTLFGCSTS